uniref:Uncharacterized protein n=1 Tax=Timema poppense TaxID=170557 RepID=A0A7R9DWA7_TIMPO|nr:unnamed protein product [Timema poppensis]
MLCYSTIFLFRNLRQNGKRLNLWLSATKKSLGTSTW